MTSLPMYMPPDANPSRANAMTRRLKPVGRSSVDFQCVSSPGAAVGGTARDAFGACGGGPTPGTHQALGHHLCGLQNAEQSGVERSSECVLERGAWASWQK